MITNFNINENLTLNIITKKESRDLFNLINSNRKYLNTWLPWVEYTNSEEDSLLFIEESIRNYENNRSIQYTIYYKNQLAGLLGINDINTRIKSISLGYWIGESFQGKGIITESIKYLINQLKKSSEFHRIEIRADKNNIKSRSVAERLDFNLEGVLRDADWINNHFEDVIIYSLLIN